MSRHHLSLKTVPLLDTKYTLVYGKCGRMRVANALAPPCLKLVFTAVTKDPTQLKTILMELEDYGHNEPMPMNAEAIWNEYSQPFSLDNC